jgi:hypothetical protein
LDGTEDSAEYIDQWARFGHYDIQALDATLQLAVTGMEWPQDKQDVGELMFLLYRMGETIPFDHAFFGMQYKILTYFQGKIEPNTDEAFAMADALRFLNNTYITVANKYLQIHLITDKRKVDVLGVHQAELQNPRMLIVKQTSQSFQETFLKYAAEALEIEFPYLRD